MVSYSIVAGELIPLHEITEAHEELMTSEEYAKYFELFNEGKPAASQDIDTEFDMTKE